MLRKVLVILSLLSFVFPGFIIAKEPANLGLLRQELIRYHDSNEYSKDIDVVIQQAMVYLKTNTAKKNGNQKLAIVLDIDETSLSNYPNLLKLNFGGTKDEMWQAEKEGVDPVITATLKLYQYAKNHDIAVFFVTGRHENERNSTVLNLKNAGFNNWDGLFLKPNDYTNKSAAPYKIAIRKEITKQGYHIVLNIGDQESDLQGGFADKTFKLPNPFYYIA